jgi:ribosomal protein L14E/L6E/L27E
MGLLEKGRKCVIMQGRYIGKKIIIDKMDSKYIYYKVKEKEEKIGIQHVFPLE